MTPTDADFEDMRHALGLPDDPHVETYRNHYCCEAGGEKAQRFEALGTWRLVQLINRNEDAIYRVTDAGRCALAAWLEQTRFRARIKRWRVFGEGLTSRIVFAKSAAQARYATYLSLSDAWPLTFREFLTLGIQARRA